MLRERVCRTIVAIGGLAFVVLWFLNPTFSKDKTTQELLRSLVSHILGSIVFAALLLFVGNRLWTRPTLRHAALVVPALLIAVNNFPIIALASGNAVIEKWNLFLPLLLDCFLIGVFEEFAFRGTLFLALLQKHHKTRAQVIRVTVLSAALFGLVHFANLLEGAGIVPTLMQVGYSFLIGGMCSIVLLRTGNLFYCVLIHGVYDLGGRLLLLGGGNQWDRTTVVITVILSVLVTAWMIWMLLCTTTADADRFFKKKRVTDHAST